MKKKIVSRFFINSFLMVIILVSTIPIIWVFISSFKTEKEIFASALSLPKQFNLNNYIIALESVPIPAFFLNSIIVSGASTFLNVLILSMSGYVFARFNFPFKKVLMLVLTLSLLIPRTALIFPLYSVIRTLSLIDTKIGLIIVYTSLCLPISLYILRSYFLTIPKEIEESADLDGAGFLRTFFSVAVPLSLPGISTAAFMTFLGTWNDFLYALTLTTGLESRTLPLAFNYFNSQFVANYGPMFAATVMIALPVIIVYFVLQEQVVSGLTAGAVKI